MLIILTLKGLVGSTYAFYSMAMDYTGNVEDIPQVPDTSTAVVANQPLIANSLWPPNHKMVTITANVQASDTCDPNPTVTLVSITSNEPDNGLGDGDTANDIQGAGFGTDDRTFALRAERSGTGARRIYTVTYQARNSVGNTSNATAQVVVPHDQGKK